MNYGVKPFQPLHPRGVDVPPDDDLPRPMFVRPRPQPAGPNFTLFDWLALVVLLGLAGLGLFWIASLPSSHLLRIAGTILPPAVASALLLSLLRKRKW